ncbi:DUF4235 domain-containing protein [Rubrivirga marina]|uniref:DUF4235 domain-containing protein n=1 Tax=Rubrivirga marina TaxID=1196024 RepID=A0A271J4G6_9BACT|nr:DUF4235 domain-containing protein [Rubrivirga marina]PAP78333.1 hypothetical protein BSZ37_18860 [Rubrivirga marina]
MLTHKQRWIAVSGLSAMAAAFATRSLLRRSWHAATGEDPPMNPADSDTAWTEAAVWTIAASVVAGLSRLTARRAAAHVLDGSVPDDKFGG